MANEINLRTSLSIRKGALQFQSFPQSFTATMLGSGGPTPGYLTVATTPGTDVSLAQLVGPGGMAFLVNLDPTNFVTYGIHDAVTHEFYPLGEIQPNEAYAIRTSRHLGNRYTDVGTGVGGPTLRFVADTAACKIAVYAFDA